MRSDWAFRQHPGLLLMCCLSLATACQVAARADEWYELHENALATFDFEGLPLPSSVAELKQRYPSAVIEPQRGTEQVGLECYAVNDLPSVDSARFYFCDGHLYQFEARYELPRIEALGGSRFVVQNLVDRWGPADHVGESRWTWNRPTYSRRADFYRWPDGAKLTVTDTSWMPVVNRRIRQAEAKQPMDLGFETR